MHENSQVRETWMQLRELGCALCKISTFSKIFPVTIFFKNLLIYYCSNFCSLLPQLQFLSQPPPFLLSGSISFALHYMPKSHSHMYNTCTGFFFCFPFLSSAHLFTHLMAQPIYHCSNQHNAVCTVATVTLCGHRPGKVTESESVALAKH